MVAVVPLILGLISHFRSVGRDSIVGEGDESFDGELFEYPHVHDHGDCDGEGDVGDLCLGWSGDRRSVQWPFLEGKGEREFETRKGLMDCKYLEIRRRDDTLHNELSGPCRQNMKVEHCRTRMETMRSDERSIRNSMRPLKQREDTEN